MTTSSLIQRLTLVVGLCALVTAIAGVIAAWILVPPASDHAAIAPVILIMFVVAAAATFAAHTVIQRLLSPIDEITQRAKRMSEGQLDMPIRIESNTDEFRLLADTLERSRVNFVRTFEIQSLAKDWSESLIQSINEGIITFDEAGRVTFFSDGAAQITAWPCPEAIGQPINEVLRLHETNGDFTTQVPAERGRQIVQVTTYDKRPITLAITRSRHTGTGQVTVVLHDITEETHLRNLQAYFIANISHEFRTPLAGLKASIELLLENARYLSAVETGELLNSIHLNVTSLQNLVDNLLESTKIEANHFVLRRRPTELNTVLSEAIRMMQPILNRRQQRLSLARTLHVPGLNVDAVRVTQVLVNLLSNASKYSPMESVIDLTVQMDDDKLRVAVADQGEGVPPEEREDIFRRFLQLEHSSSEDYGVGLGLFVVKTIVEEHGGSVGVSDRNGSGAVFWFTLPLDLTGERQEV
jgi:PAS domain S-box-containing protein